MSDLKPRKGHTIKQPHTTNTGLELKETFWQVESMVVNVGEKLATVYIGCYAMESALLDGLEPIETRAFRFSGSDYQKFFGGDSISITKIVAFLKEDDFFKDGEVS